MKLPRRKVFVRALLMSMTITVTLVIAGIATRTNIEQEIAEAASSVTDITSTVASGSVFNYGGAQCGSLQCYQLQGFTVTDDKLVFYTNNGDVGNLNAYSSSDFSTQVSGSPKYKTTFGHGNDMTYNTQTGKIAVVGPGNYKEIYIVNSSTLTKESSVDVDDTWAIGYDEFHNYYVLLQGKIRLVDENFTKKKEFSYSLDGNTSQGLEYHNGYVYYTASSSDYNSAYIYVYNAKLKSDGTAEANFGERVATFYVNTASLGSAAGGLEIETISFRDNKAYLGFATSDLTIRFYRFSDNKIEIPLKTTVKYTNNKHSTKVTVTGTDQLKARSGYTLSDDGYSLSKTVSAGSISESTKFCDNYNNCVTLDLSHTNSNYVEQQSQTVSFADSSVTKTYGDAAFTNAATTTGDGTITYESSDTNVATVGSSSGKVTIKSAGTVTITATAAETDNYTSATKSYTLTVKKASQTVSFADSSVTKTYGDAAFTNAATTTGDGTISYASSNTDIATVNSSGKVTIKGAGNVTITATVVATTNYNSASKSYTLTVNKANQTVSFANSSVTKTYGDAVFTNAASTTGDGSITYMSNNTSVAIVNSNTGAVTIKGVGSAQITATAAATGNCNSASKTYTLTVNKANQTVSFADSSVTKTYGDAAFTNVATTTGNGAITYSSSNDNIATVNSNGKVTIYAAGTVTITATAAATSNYNSASKDYVLTVNNASQTLSFENTSSNMTIDHGTNFSNRATSTNSAAVITYVSSDTNVATVDNYGKIFTKKSGKVTITATAMAENYNSVSKSYDLSVQYKLQFDANGGEGSVAPEVCIVSSNNLSSCNVEVPEADLNMEGYYFLGWALDGAATVDTNNVGDTIELSDNRVLYAVWAPIYTLTFDLNMDMGIDDASVVDSELANGAEDDDEELTVETQTCHPDTTDGTCSVFIPFTDIAREGYEFFGWAKTATSASTDYLSGQKFTFTAGKYDEVLYALWADGDIVWVQGTEYALGSGNDMVFRINFPLNHFESLMMDGEEVLEGNYKLEEGSTIVTLRASYLDGLDIGEHELIIAYDNGATVTTKFEIAERVVAPDTGEVTSNLEGNIMSVVYVVPAILLVAYVAMRVWKNKKAHVKFD